MTFKSAKFEIREEEFGTPGARAEVEIFPGGLVSGGARYNGAEIEFRRASLNDLDFIATMLVFIVERMHEEKAKFS